MAALPNWHVNSSRYSGEGETVCHSQCDADKMRRRLWSQRAMCRPTTSRLENYANYARSRSGTQWVSHQCSFTVSHVDSLHTPHSHHFWHYVLTCSAPVSTQRNETKYVQCAKSWQMVSSLIYRTEPYKQKQEGQHPLTGQRAANFRLSFL